MRRIGKALDNGLGDILGSYRADLKRAGSVQSCRSLHVAAMNKELSSRERLIRGQISRNILRSLKVCGKDCVQVSFKREVGAIRASLVTLASDAKAFARKVVQCAGSGRVPNGQGAGGRTDRRIDSILNGLKKVPSVCQVCPQA